LAYAVAASDAPTEFVVDAIVGCANRSSDFVWVGEVRTAAFAFFGERHLQGGE